MEQPISKGRVHSINVSNGGVPKLPIAEALIGPSGVAGDKHSDNDNHGGLDRALCLFSLERISKLQAEGHPIVPGAIGENITIQGVDWAMLAPGSRIHLGD